MKGKRVTIKEGMAEFMEIFTGGAGTDGGIITHVHGDDVSHIEEINPNVVDEDKVVYFSEKSKRHFIIKLKHVEVL